ncbi:membrane spanning protein [Staphylococcus aureus]|nr:membrane spanning protein [Staphylococcus aureus]
MNKTVKDLILVVLGSFIFAAGVNAFIISGNLGEGGVTGLAIILYYAFHNDRCCNFTYSYST